MFKRYEHWVEGLNQDWCISRQRYNGVPFPVWYDASGQVILADPAQLPVNPLVDSPVGAKPCFAQDAAATAERAKHGFAPTGIYAPSRDVMDTWATSSVTPLLNTHLRIGLDDAEVAARHAQIFPYDLRPAGARHHPHLGVLHHHQGLLPLRRDPVEGHRDQRARAGRRAARRSARARAMS